MIFSKRLKDLREEKGYTRTYVAEQCDVSIQCISSLEAGTRSPTGSTLVALASFFDVSIDYLMGREDSDTLIFSSETTPSSKEKPQLSMLRLRELRKERNLRQKDVAQAIGVLPQSYGFYENGINKPDPDTLIRLANFFQCSIDYLVGRSDDFGAVQVNSSGDILSKEEKKLLETYRQLDMKGKIHVETYAELRLEELKGSPSRRA